MHINISVNMNYICKMEAIFLLSFPHLSLIGTVYPKSSFGANQYIIFFQVFGRRPILYTSEGARMTVIGPLSSYQQHQLSANKGTQA